MKVDWEAFKRARKARDARFDGKFFVASTTTKIYCRPSCNVPMIKDKYVRYFANAAAAENAGFRPCLRCRPECAPGTPAWNGTFSTVSRALRLISESGLEDGGVESLAKRLGVGPRHLRRLFLQHVGATPSSVANTRRLHFAKKLIDETSLPMNQVALSAGFGSVRRFNATILKTYKRRPTHLRKLARQKRSAGEDHYQFRLNFRPPYHWQALLAFLAPRCTPGVEAVHGGRYRRSISIKGSHGWLEASFDEKHSAIVLNVHFSDPGALFFITERARAMFDLNADASEIAATLSADPLLRPWVRATPGLRVPGCWDPFELSVRAILGQQISVKAASALAGRLTALFGHPTEATEGLTHLFPGPEILATADLNRAGVTKARSETMRALAVAVLDGKVSFEGVLDSQRFEQQLCEVRGIGPWTAQYIAMRALGDPDAFPAGDLGLQRALGLVNARATEERTHAWRPWRAYAALYLWQSLHLETRRAQSDATPEQFVATPVTERHLGIDRRETI